jgi:hypothetical protein
MMNSLGLTGPARGVGIGPETVVGSADVSDFGLSIAMGFRNSSPLAMGAPRDPRTDGAGVLIGRFSGRPISVESNIPSGSMVEAGSAAFLNARPLAMSVAIASGAIVIQDGHVRRESEPTYGPTR